MADFRPLITIEGIKCAVNFDAVSYIVARDDNSSIICFKGDDESLLVKGSLDVIRRHYKEWPYGNKNLMCDDAEVVK
jgi:hypothetical protein